MMNWDERQVAEGIMMHMSALKLTRDDVYSK